MANRMNGGVNIRDKDFDGSAWSKNNDDSFKELVAQAQRKRALRAEAEEILKPGGSDLPVPAPGKSDEDQPPTDEVTAIQAPSNTSHLQEEPNTDRIPVSPRGRSSQRRFFEQNASLPFERPSSQQQVTQILDRDIGISSEIATLRPLQN